MQKPLGLVFASAGLAFLLYAAFVQFAPIEIATGQNQDATNMIRVQTYLAAPDERVVLTGSSLTFRLPQSALG